VAVKSDMILGIDGFSEPSITETEHMEKVAQAKTRKRSVRPLLREFAGNCGSLIQACVSGERPATARRDNRVELDRRHLRTLIDQGRIAERLTERQIAALIMVETSGKNGSIGDNGTSFGVLQIQEGYVADVNETFGTNLRATDCLWDIDLSVLVTQAWMNRYTTERCSFEVKARKHNGGPTGHNKSATLPYWAKVRKAYAADHKVAFR